jgi:hypothetical protein
MGTWGNHQDGEEWYNNNVDDLPSILDFLNNPSECHPLESRISRLSALAWNYSDTELQISAVENLTTELGRDYTKYDYEHLVGLWQHENDSVAEAAKQASKEYPPSVGKSYSVEMMLDNEDPSCQILACDILGEINDQRVAEILYTLAIRVKATDDVKEHAMSALCKLGNISYFKRVYKLCHDGNSVAVSSDLNRLLENFYKVGDRKKRAEEYAGVINWILVKKDDYIRSEHHKIAINIAKSMNFFKSQRTQRNDLIIILKEIVLSDSAASVSANNALKMITEIELRKTEQKERKRNLKQTGISETNSKRTVRESNEEFERERQRKKNFQEIQLRETDEERSERERRERLDRERKANFEETKCSETDNERKMREYRIIFEAEINERKIILQGQESEKENNYSKYGITATDEEIKSWIELVDSPETVNNETILRQMKNCGLFIGHSKRSMDLIFNAFTIILNRTEITRVTKERILRVALIHCRRGLFEDWLVHFEHLKIGKPLD